MSVQVLVHDTAAARVEALETPPDSQVRAGRWYAPLKPVFDLGIALVLLLPTVLMIVGLVVLTRLSSRGPGIYRQVRLGRGGRPFTMYKIRTMGHACECSTGACWSVTGDPRVTGLGRWLRRTHLDELPQLWNVIRGEMSLVGPRPERPEFVAQLERVIPEYGNRLLVRPGVTGLAQVQLPADEDVAGVARKVACDNVYVASLSPWLDLRIILGTAFKVAGVPFHVTRHLLALPGVRRSSAGFAEFEQDSVSQPISA